MLIDSIENGKPVTIEVADPELRERRPASPPPATGDSFDGPKKRGLFHRDDLVRHETHGVCTVIEEWGMWRSCRMCYKPCAGETCERCGSWTYDVSGSGVYDVLCPDGKIRSVNQEWLYPVAASGALALQRPEMEVAAA